MPILHHTWTVVTARQSVYPAWPSREYKYLNQYLYLYLAKQGVYSTWTKVTRVDTYISTCTGVSDRKVVCTTWPRVTLGCTCLACFYRVCWPTYLYIPHTCTVVTARQGVYPTWPTYLYIHHTWTVVTARQGVYPTWPTRGCTVVTWTSFIIFLIYLEFLLFKCILTFIDLKVN